LRTRKARTRVELIRHAIRPSHSGDFEESFRRLDEIARSSPTDTEVLRWKGNLLEEYAYEDLARANRFDPDDERLVVARRCYERILKKDPSNARAMIDLGESLRYQGKWTQALRLFNRALDVVKARTVGKRCPEELEAAYSCKIRILVEMNRWNEANKTKEVASRECPKSREIKSLRVVRRGKVGKSRRK
jgi:tetratricopeptide (TPR) repeat protein